MKPKKKTTKTNQQPVVKAIVGLGMDESDGHRRVTQTEEMVLLGGSEQTHEQMQETAIRFAEGLQSRGKKLPEASPKEVIELLQRAIEKTQ